MKPSHANPAQDDLPLRSLDTDTFYPGRKALYVSEVACDLRCSIQHVINLIQQFEDTGGAQGLKGFTIHVVKPGTRTPRSWWRVAKSDYQTFLRKRATSHHS